MKKRILIAAILFSWATASMYLVWFTKFELIGVAGFLLLVALNASFKKVKLGGAA
jgi:hypothetical protein